MPSPKLPMFLAASARFLLTASVPLFVGIGIPRTRFRALRLPSTTPPARPTSPAPAASAGTFAFSATPPKALPAFFTRSLGLGVPSRDRIDAERLVELELERLLVEEFLVCWGMRASFPQEMGPHLPYPGESNRKRGPPRAGKDSGPASKNATFDHQRAQLA
jgi:hypothetical protein